MDYKIPFSSKRSSCTNSVLVLFYSLIKYKHFQIFFVLAKTILSWFYLQNSSIIFSNMVIDYSFSYIYFS